MSQVTDYGHMMVKSMILCKFKSQSQIVIWDLDLKAYFFRNEKHGQGTHNTKMGTDKVFEKYSKCPKTYLPKLSAQAQKFGILMKKGIIGCPYSVSQVVTIAMHYWSAAGTGTPRLD